MKNGSDILEWVGGSFALDGEVEGARPVAVVWMEQPSGLVVFLDISTRSHDEGVLARTLRKAMKKPLAGKPRRPDRIRVADPVVADELRAEHRGIEVVVALAPELAELIAAMPAAAAAPKVVENGAVSPERIDALFRAAERLYRVAPWRFVRRLTGVDIPQLGIEAACLAMVDRGIELFPSEEQYEANALVRGRYVRDADVISTEVLSLRFERKACMTPPMQRAIEEYGWRTDEEDGYPNPEFHDGTGALLPLGEREVLMLAACASALATFCTRHRPVFSSYRAGPVSESFAGEDGLAVRLTYPIQAFDLFEDGPFPGGIKVPLRLDGPCDCGSGNTYRMCHLAADRKAERGPDGVHVRDRRLVNDILCLATRRYGDDWLPRELKHLSPEDAFPLFRSWAAYQMPVEGRPLADHFVEATPSLDWRERAWIMAQRAGWLSVWEVLSVTPGKALEVRDLLSGEMRTVRERNASQTLRAQDTILARVVDHEGVSFFGGMYGRTLSPRDAAEVLRDVRAKLRIQTAAVPVHRLRAGNLGSFLIERWADAVDGIADRPNASLELQNADGDAVAFVTDRFSFDAGDRAAVEERLAALARDTVLAKLVIGDGVLRVETSSERRAEAVRRKVEEACGGLIRHRSREQKDPLRLQAERQPAAAPPRVHTEDEQRAIREFKRKHYQRWLDESIPALGGKTPRQAARSRDGRAELDSLLRQIEHCEAILEEGERFDVAWLRAELGM